MDNVIYCKLGGTPYLLSVREETDAYMVARVVKGNWPMIYDKVNARVYAVSTFEQAVPGRQIADDALMTHRRDVSLVNDAYEQVFARIEAEIAAEEAAEGMSIPALIETIMNEKTGDTEFILSGGVYEAGIWSAGIGNDCPHVNLGESEPQLEAEGESIQEALEKLLALVRAQNGHPG